MLKCRVLLCVIIVFVLGSFLLVVVPRIAEAQPGFLVVDDPVPDSVEEAPVFPAEGSSEKAHDKPTPKRAGPRPRARWSEDWSTLGNPAPFLDTETPPSDEFWRPIKYIPLNESGESYLSFGGEFRLAYERYEDKDMGISDIGLQDAWQLRLAAHGDWHLNRRWRIFGQLGYGEILDSREGGEKAMDETDIDIWQLLIDYRMPVGKDERVVFRLGRQLIETGNLFINAGEGNNVRQVYDGLRVGWLAGDFIKAASFAVEYVDFADGSFDMSGTGEYFWGFRTGMRWQRPALNLHFLYTGWSLKDRQFEQGGGARHDELRHTVLIWVNRPLGSDLIWLNRPLAGEQQWGVDYYLAYQFGRYDDQPGGSDIRAFAAFGEAKHAFFQQANTPIAGLKTAYFSGDSDPNDDELNTFYDHVFATPFFGYARDIQPFNLIFVQPNLGYQFGDRALFTLGYGFHWRADTNDAFYGSPNAITARAGVSDSSWLGQQAQLGVRYFHTPNLLISSYLARFFAGDVIKDAGGDDRDYFHIGVHYLF
jgi:hypothetical protein